MEIERKLILLIFKDFSSTQTITSLARALHLSRVGIWKVLKKLETKKYIRIDAVGKGRTNTFIITLNWENILVEKALSLYLAEEAMQYQRWRFSFKELEKEVDFTVLFGSIVHSSKQANDIDIINISKKHKFVDIQKSIDIIQKSQMKKIHAINFTEAEFKQELRKQNKVFIEAIKNGIILFGQEKFIRFMKEIVQ